MKAALFAFNGDPMCFVHVLLNAFDMQEKGHEVTIIMEGSASKLVRTYAEDESQPFAKLYAKARDAGLIGCVCKACSAKMGSLDSALEQGIAVCDEMQGHPSISRFIAEGFQVFTF